MNLLPNDVLPSSSYVSRWTFRKITPLPSYSHGGFIMQNRDTFAFPHLSAASSLFISRRCKCSPASQFSYLNGLLQLFKYSLAFCVTEVRYNFTLGIKAFGFLPWVQNLQTHSGWQLWSTSLYSTLPATFLGGWPLTPHHQVPWTSGFLWVWLMEGTNKRSETGKREAGVFILFPPHHWFYFSISSFIPSKPQLLPVPLPLKFPLKFHWF